MLLQELLKTISYQSTDDIQGIDIRNICTDSRLAQKGDLFVALSGGKADGHDFLDEACRRGVAAAVCERKQDIPVPVILCDDTRRALSFLAAAYYGQPQEKLKIIGVTGTNGKTTTCRFLASILQTAGKKAANIGTLGCFYAEKSLLPDLTTPDPLRLFSLFADMVKEGVEYVVMEVSAHAIYYKKIAAIAFTACIFTNCTQDHLDFFGDMAHYAAVKKSLFKEGCGKAIVNVDDDLGIEITQTYKDSSSYSLCKEADNTAEVCRTGEEGSQVVFRLRGEKVFASIRLAGKYNVANALASSACAYSLGISAQEIAAGVEGVDRVSGRLERAGSVRGGTVFIDFAHTPDGLEKALTALKEICTGRLLCVFGCGGDRDRGKRPLMGEIAGKLTDFTVLTSDNPRYEEPYSIISAIEEGYCRYSNRYVVVQDRRRAIEYAVRLLKEGDILLIAGKGGERYQEIMGIQYDYDERFVVRDILQKIGAE
jgi:UDP-N-acetylmuramoyl-L-alanyl-D-glutamate--2,6-diaminopimelate ligase